MAMPSDIGTTQERGEELTAFLDEWLRFYGPVSTEWLAGTLALPAEELTPALDDLQDEQRVVQGRLVAEGNEDDLCDAENFEILLRMARAAAVPSFAPLPVEDLPRFLAQVQGISKPGDDVDDLWARLEGLSGYPARAELWEEAILPARMRFYDGAWLDSLMQEGNLHWIGIEKGRVAFCLEDDLPLLPARAAKDDLRDLLPDIHGRYGLSALAVKTGQSMEQLVARLWEGVWGGIVSNDSVAALRKGIQQDFQPPKLPQVDTQRHGRRVPRGASTAGPAPPPSPATGTASPERRRPACPKKMIRTSLMTSSAPATGPACCSTVTACSSASCCSGRRRRSSGPPSSAHCG